jgi:hypothetical protein
MTVHELRSNKMFYVVYSEYAQRIRIEYNMYSFKEAQDKALSWCMNNVNRKAVVYSITQKESQPREEYVAKNQYVEVQEEAKAS